MTLRNDRCAGLKILRRQMTFMDADAKFFSALFERAPEAMIVTDEIGRIREANRAACVLHAVDRDELVRMRLTDLVPFSVDLRMAAHTLMETGQASYEVTETNFDGTSSTLRLEGVRFRPQRYLIVFRDVTAERELERALPRARQMDLLGRAALGIIHDLNNLLVPILCYSDLVGTEADPTARDEMLGDLHAAAEQAASLAARLLMLGREPSGSAVLLSLNGVVTGMKDLLARTAGENIEMQIHLDPDLAGTRAERDELDRLLMNLVLNARDAMPEGGKLIIGTYTDPVPRGDTRYVVLSVTDTGHGMDHQTRSRIFEPFFTTKAAGRGTGLGLSTALASVERAGGFIDVDSEPDRGTTFRVHLPAADESARSISLERKSAPKGTETVLLVEDEPAARQAIRRALEDYGYRVLEASSGASAIEVASACQGTIDLLLSDVVLPDMHGGQLFEHLTRAGRRLSVLYMTGHRLADAASRGLDDPEVLISKPFSAADIAKRVRRALDAEPANERW